MGKRQDLRNKQQQKIRKQQLTALIIILVMAVLISGFVILQSLKPVGEIKTLEIRNHPQVKELTMGNPEAKIVVEEFSDFQCVACYRFWQNSEPEFIDKYVATGKVFYKYSPFSFIGEESFQAAEAAYCANEKCKFEGGEAGLGFRLFLQAEFYRFVASIRTAVLLRFLFELRQFDPQQDFFLGYTCRHAICNCFRMELALVAQAWQ